MKYLILILAFIGCTKSEPIKPTETIGDLRHDTIYLNCQTIIYSSWNVYRNGEVFQAFDAKKLIGEPCVITKRDEKILN